MERYRTGYMTKGDTYVAIIYTIPADRKLADMLNITCDMFNPPVWQVRDTGDKLEIYYEAESDICRFPVYKKATGDVYKAALMDIKRTIKKEAA